MNQNDTEGARLKRLLSGMKRDVADTQVVATLAWADAVERLDILIMEIRHIQSNIAQLLRKPRLLNLLRYEEIFIWGTVGAEDEEVKAPKSQALPDWIDLFGELDDARARLTDLSSFFVPPIDSRSERREAGGFDDIPMLERYQKRRLCLIEDVSEDVDESLYLSGNQERPNRAQWGQEHRRNYHLFRALQRMKRNLVLAKLQLCWWGSWAYRLIGRNDGAPAIETKRLAHFIAVRAAVMVKLGDAVARLGDLQSQFERALDLGPQEIARPLGGRRRHGALTAAFLHNRSHDLWTDMQELMTELGVKQASSEVLKPITAHRWNHDAQWSNHVIFDETTKRRDVDQSAAPAIDFLVSSYWAPDRPDLQVMLAHDAAAASLRLRLPLTDRMQLAGDSSPLGELLKMLNHTINHYRPGQKSMLRRTLATAGQVRATDHASDSKSDDRATERNAADMSIDRSMAFDLDTSFSRAKQDLLPLLAADLLAASVYGGAYLFALYQNLLGRGLEQLFRTPGGQIDLGIAKEALDLSHLDEEIPFYWYLRIKVVCAWLKVITFDGERSALGETLIGGIERLSNDLLEHTHDLYRGEARQWPVLWKELTGRLCLVVSSNAAADDVSVWRRERLRPYGDAERIRRNRRASRPMPPDIARFLKSVLIRQKWEKPGRGLNRNTEWRNGDETGLKEAARRFEDLYLRDSETGLTPMDDLDQHLNSLRFFRSLHDIPWEAAIMRGADFLDDLEHRGPLRHSRWHGFGPISTMSLDFHPGRETFQVALDFHLFLSKRRSDRLLNSLTLVKGILDKCDGAFESEKLKEWFGSPPKESRNGGELWAGLSPKMRLERWINPAGSDDRSDTDDDQSKELSFQINDLSSKHRNRIVDDDAVRLDCEEMAAKATVKSLLRMSAGVQVPSNGNDTKQRVDPAAEYILDRIQHAKLEQLAEALNRRLIFAAGIRMRQGGRLAAKILPVNRDCLDWKIVSSLIALHIYLEMNSTAGPEEDDTPEENANDDNANGYKGDPDEKHFKEKRRFARNMILEALSGAQGSTKGGTQSIHVKEIAYLSISGAMDHPDGTEDQLPGSRPEGEASEHLRHFRQLYDPPLAEVHSFACPQQVKDAVPDWPKATYAACLGRFDRILLSDSSPLLTHRLPRFSRTDDKSSAARGGDEPLKLPYRWDVPVATEGKADVEEFSTFVQRREIALRLSLKMPEDQTEGLVPLALVSIGLTQRYSRIDFVARLLRAIRDRPMIGAYALEGAYHLIEPGDEAYLTDGAYDLTMVLKGPAAGNPEERFARLRDVMRLSITLHGDFMVDRTETHLLAPMIDCILAEENQSLSIFQEVRLKESSTQQYAYRFLHEKFREIVERENANIRLSAGTLNYPDDVTPKDLENLEAIQPRMHIVPGRADVAISFDSRWLKLHWRQLSLVKRRTGAGMLDQLMRIVLKDWYVDRIVTTIGVAPEVLLAWKSSDPNGDPTPAEDRGEADSGDAGA